MKNIGLANMQNRLTEMLEELDKFCKEHNIEFFLVGGSALGAYRHKGFIPWDDDIDIAMLRDEFERFEEIINRQKNKIGSCVYSPVENHLIPEAPIGYLYDVKKARANLGKVAKIDIHPIDGVPQNRILRKIQKIISLAYYLSEYRQPVKNKGKLIRNISKLIIKITPDTIFDFYMKIGKRFMTRWDAKRSCEVCSLFGLAGYEKETMPLAYLYPLKEMDFQGKKYRIPKEIELYLERLYGNYMELPKEEERKPRHEVYRNYENE